MRCSAPAWSVSWMRWDVSLILNLQSSLDVLFLILVSQSSAPPLYKMVWPSQARQTWVLCFGRHHSLAIQLMSLCVRLGHALLLCKPASDEHTPCKLDTCEKAIWRGTCGVGPSRCSRQVVQRTGLGWTTGQLRSVQHL